MEQIIIHSLLSDASYVGQNGGWTTLLDKARCFSSARDAERLCREHKLVKVEILVLREQEIVTKIPVDLNGPAL